MENKKKLTVALVCLGVLLVAGIGWLLASMLITPKVNLNDYVIVKVKGDNGEGELKKLAVDYDALAEKYAHRAKNGYYYEGQDAYCFFVMPEDDPDWTGSVSFRYKGASDREEAAEMAFRTCTPKVSVENNEVDYEILGLVKRSDLSNGEIIEIVWREDENTEAKIERLELLFDIEIDYEDFSYTVKGLD